MECDFPCDILQLRVCLFLSACLVHVRTCHEDRVADEKLDVCLVRTVKLSHSPAGVAVEAQWIAHHLLKNQLCAGCALDDQVTRGFERYEVVKGRSWFDHPSLTRWQHAQSVIFFRVLRVVFILSCAHLPVFRITFLIELWKIDPLYLAEIIRVLFTYDLELFVSGFICVCHFMYR